MQRPSPVPSPAAASSPAVEPWMTVDTLLCRLCQRAPTESLTPLTFRCNICGGEFTTTIYRTGGGYNNYAPSRCILCARKTVTCQSCNKRLDPKDKAACKPKTATRLPVE
ncbi:hypothetical protein PAPYR_1209 [Paratrimastix pyriformis]|uniref:Uncharacterized protein n=1 Tax=Paratrimastix pyriformis TaxID=342808 RepID=A0ABQ8USE7_9EUKA|nr:hypothetical protein PAPYR_1209 [Paratrimastix pyriformis]